MIPKKVLISMLHFYDVPWAPVEFLNFKIAEPQQSSLKFKEVLWTLTKFSALSQKLTNYLESLWNLLKFFNIPRITINFAAVYEVCWTFKNCANFLQNCLKFCKVLKKILRNFLTHSKFIKRQQSTIKVSRLLWSFLKL